MSSGPGMPDMSDLLQNVLGNLPGMENLPASEKKKMKKAIKATTEKVQSLDLESIFKTALEGDEGNAPPQTPKKASIDRTEKLRLYHRHPLRHSN